MVTAIESPRALKVPVGLAPSSLSQAPGKRRLFSIGVQPSPSVTGSASGRTERYRHIPLHGRVASLAITSRGFVPFRGEISYRTKSEPAGCDGHSWHTVCGVSAETRA